MRVNKKTDVISITAIILVFLVSCSIISLVGTIFTLSNESAKIDDSKNMLASSTHAFSDDLVIVELDYVDGSILASMQTLEYGYDYEYSNFTKNVILFNPDSISITTPNNACSWKIGTSKLINWTSTGTISNVKIELYKAGVFEMEIVANTTNDGAFLWTIPLNLLYSIQYQVIITDVTSPTTKGFSGYFEIFTTLSDLLSVTSPESLTVWEMGKIQEITWTSTVSITDVKIDLYKGGMFLLEIVESTPNDGSYNWTIPTDLTDDIDYQIRVADVSNSTTYDDSPNFAITAVGTGSNTPGIPGYNLLFLLGIICVISTIFMRKLFKRKLIKKL